MPPAPRRLLSAVLVAAPAVALAAPAGAAGAGWTPAEPVSAPGHEAPYPEVAFDRDGRIVASWIWAFGGPPSLFVESATRRPGEAWTAPVTGPDVSTEGVVDTEIAPDGSIHVVDLPWSEFRSIATHHKPFGGPWTTEDGVAPSDSSLAYPQLVVGPTGVRAAAWVQFVNGQNTVRTAVGPPGGPLRPTIDGYHPQPGVQDAAIAVEPSGTASMVYVDGGRILATSRASLGWNYWTEVTPAAEQAAAPSLVVGADGTATAVWRAFVSGSRVIRVSERASGGTWSVPMTLGTAAGDSRPVLSASTDGGRVAGWVLSGRLRVATRTGSGTWSGAEAVSPAGSTVGPYSIAAGPSGAAGAAWSRQSGGANAPAVALRPAGQGWSPHRDLSPPTTTTFQAADIAFDGSGNAVAAWGGTGIRTSVYDATPPSVDASVPAEAVAGQAVTLTGSATDAWSPVASDLTWDFGDGASASGAQVTHTYAAAGTYTVTTRARDAAGNTGGVARTVTVNPPPPPRPEMMITSLAAGGRWVRGRFRGTIAVAGVAEGRRAFLLRVGARSGAVLRLDRRQRRIPLVSRTVPVAGGPFTHRAALPAGLLPGVYTVEVTGPGGASRTARIVVPAPPDGIPESPTATATRIGGGGRMTARFRFAVLPASRRAPIAVEWIEPGRRRGIRVGRRYGPVVTTTIRSARLAAGPWRCRLIVNGRVVATARITLR